MPAMTERGRTRPGATPLANSHLRVTIEDLLASYELRHVFRNTGDRPIEAVYSFPIPLDAAFMGMEATLAEETRTAQVLTAASATRTYDDAVAEGNSAVLLERLEPGMLCVNLGNLKPGEEGEIVLRFTAALGVADREARFSLPLVHRPRYGRYRLEEWQVPRPDFAVEHPLEAEIIIRGLLAGRPVRCAAQGARFQSGDGETVLQLTGAMLDRDLVLNFDLGDEPVSGARVIENGEHAIGVLSFVPAPRPGREPSSASALDLCMVLDCSGSMNGDAIAQTRNALAAVAGELGEGDRIQVLRFGTAVKPMFRRPLKASARVKDALDQLLPTIKADLGGTRMDSALRKAISQLEPLPEGAEQKVVILVTDGAVQPHEIGTARDQAAKLGIRIFVVAVGSSAGADALAPLAEATGGALERAVPGEPVEGGVMRQFRRARWLRPLAVEIDWKGPARQLPVGNAYPGDAVTVIAFLEGDGERDVAVRIPGIGDELAFVLDEVRPSAAWRAWAGQRAYASASPEERQALALEFGLITDETSAVLVKVRDAADQADGLPEMVSVPHMLPEGMLVMARDVTYSVHAAAARPGPGAASRGPVMARSMSVGRPRPKDAASAGDDYHHLDIPASLRRHADMDPQLHDVSEMEERRAFPLTPGEREQAERALLEALIGLLTDGEGERFDPSQLLARIPPRARVLVEQYLEQENIPLATLRQAVAAVKKLLGRVGDEGLSDDQLASLAVADGGIMER